MQGSYFAYIILIFAVLYGFSAIFYSHVLWIIQRYRNIHFHSPFLYLLLEYGYGGNFQFNHDDAYYSIEYFHSISA